MSQGLEICEYSELSRTGLKQIHNNYTNCMQRYVILEPLNIKKKFFIDEIQYSANNVMNN